MLEQEANIANAAKNVPYLQYYLQDVSNDVDEGVSHNRMGKTMTDGKPPVHSKNSYSNFVKKRICLQSHIYSHIIALLKI